MVHGESVNVELGERSYSIQIGENLLTDCTSYEDFLSGKEVLVVTNESIAGIYLDDVMTCLSGMPETLSPRKLEKLVLPDGEQYKSLETLNLIFDCLLEQKFSRGAVLIALGGGVVGDMVGFAAASYQRGVDFIQVPTTLLSQVDSSVGGKTGVNHALGKNMIGAFYQPKKVIIDIGVLKTLPPRELSAGLAEVIKYGFIRDADFFSWLEGSMERLLGLDPEALTYAIKRSCEIKAEVVAVDEKEGGLRAILNLGHTYGHAIENHQGYGQWLHGEAVGAGMVMACDLSYRLGWLDKADFDRGVALIKRADLPSVPPADMSAEDFLSIMAVDKKVEQGQLRLVLLEGLGKSLVTADFDRAILDEQLSALTT